MAKSFVPWANPNPAVRAPERDGALRDDLRAPRFSHIGRISIVTPDAYEPQTPHTKPYAWRRTIGRWSLGSVAFVLLLGCAAEEPTEELSEEEAELRAFPDPACPGPIAMSKQKYAALPASYEASSAVAKQKMLWKEIAETPLRQVVQTARRSVSGGAHGPEHHRVDAHHAQSLE